MNPPSSPNRSQITVLANQCIIGALAVALAGCTTMQTEDADVNSPVTGKARVGNFYFLPRGKITIVGTPVDNAAYSLVITRKNEADPQARKFLLQRRNVFYEDKTKLDIDAEGLLTTVNVDSEDKTPAIIDKVVDTVIDVAKIAANTSGMMGAADMKTLTLLPLSPFKCTFDPFVREQVNAARNVMWNAGFVATIVPASMETKTRVVQDELSNRGVYYRPPTTVSVKIKTRDGYVGDFMQTATVRVPDPSSIAVLSLTRPFLVKKTTNLVFVGGDLHTVDFTHPSEALGVVSIPASIASKLAAAIPAIIKIQDERANAVTARETSRLNAERDLLKAQKEYEEAKKPTASGTMMSTNSLGMAHPVSNEERRAAMEAALQAAENQKNVANQEKRELLIKEKKLEAEEAAPSPTPQP
jgi:hypothetical protein